jgi:hypothetical protein
MPLLDRCGSIVVAAFLPSPCLARLAQDLDGFLDDIDTDCATHDQIRKAVLAYAVRPATSPAIHNTSPLGTAEPVSAGAWSSFGISRTAAPRMIGVQ